MISYAPFYNTLKNKNITTYKLIQEFGVSRSLLDRLKHNKPITTQTLDDLCKFLDCGISDIIVYIKDEWARKPQRDDSHRKKLVVKRSVATASIP